MKTCVHFIELPDGKSGYTDIQGDKRHWNLCFINNGHAEEAEVLEHFYDSNNGQLLVELKSEPSKDWDYFVSCGFLL